jgi:hypothetical protein
MAQSKPPYVVFNATTSLANRSRTRRSGSPDGGWYLALLTLLAAHPRDSVALHDVVRVNEIFDARYRRLAHHAAHFAHLANMDDDRGNADNFVALLGDSRANLSRVGKSRTVEERGNILLNQHDAPFG